MEFLSGAVRDADGSLRRVHAEGESYEDAHEALVAAAGEGRLLGIRRLEEDERPGAES